MYRSSTDSWNLRDRHMFDTLARLLSARGDNAKAIVWAHNSHIGNAAATAMGRQGEFNIGESCRAAFGELAALIGFGTDRGTVAGFTGSQDRKAGLLASIPLRRAGRPEELADAILFLALGQGFVRHRPDHQRQRRPHGQLNLNPTKGVSP